MIFPCSTAQPITSLPQRLESALIRSIGSVQHGASGNGRTIYMTRHARRMLWGRQGFFIGAVMGLLIAIGGTPAIAAERSEAGPGEVGLQAASWLVTIPYGAVKVAYALGGGIVGGLAWAVTGGSTTVAKAIWIPSMTGDYIVQPEHLTGAKTLRFVGESSDKSAP